MNRSNKATNLLVGCVLVLLVSASFLFAKAAEVRTDSPATDGSLATNTPVLPSSLTPSDDIDTHVPTVPVGASPTITMVVVEPTRTPPGPIEPEPSSTATVEIQATSTPPPPPIEPSRTTAAVAPTNTPPPPSTEQSPTATPELIEPTRTPPAPLELVPTDSSTPEPAPTESSPEGGPTRTPPAVVP
jgi:hypothetical protein